MNCKIQLFIQLKKLKKKKKGHEKCNSNAIYKLIHPQIQTNKGGKNSFNTNLLWIYSWMVVSIFLYSATFSSFINLTSSTNLTCDINSTICTRNTIIATSKSKHTNNKTQVELIYLYAKHTCCNQPIPGSFNGNFDDTCRFGKKYWQISDCNISLTHQSSKLGWNLLLFGGPCLVLPAER